MTSTHTGIAVALAVIVIGMVFVFSGLSPFPRTSMPPANSQSAAVDAGTQSTNPQTTPTMPIEENGQLQITDEVVGAGAEAVVGDTVTVNYVGTFTNGTVFDASASHQETAQGFSFPLGGGRVIAGWDLGVTGMKVGGKRRLVVPPTLGYGPNDYGPIPGNSTLVFEIELLKVQKDSTAGAAQ